MTGFDAVDEFVETVEAAEIHFLSRQVRHAGGRRFEAQHQAAFEMVLGAAQFFLWNGARDLRLRNSAITDSTTLVADSSEVPA